MQDLAEALPAWDLRGADGPAVGAGHAPHSGQFVAGAAGHVPHREEQHPAGFAGLVAAFTSVTEPLVSLATQMWRPSNANATGSLKL